MAAVVRTDADGCCAEHRTPAGITIPTGLGLALRLMITGVPVGTVVVVVGGPDEAEPVVVDAEALGLADGLALADGVALGATGGVFVGSPVAVAVGGGGRDEPSPRPSDPPISRWRSVPRRTVPVETTVPDGSTA